MITYENTLEIEYLSDEDRVTSYDPLSKGLEWFNIHFPKEPCLEQLSPLFASSQVDIVHEYCTKFLTKEQLEGKHAPIIEYECELVSKTGRQGGKVPWDQAKDLFAQYYNVPRGCTVGKVGRTGRRAFLRMIKARLRKVAPPSAYRELFMQNTAFGAPYGGKKNDEYNHKQGFAQWLYMHPEVIWPNIRFMRNKVRAIFCASAHDCDAIGPDLTNVRNWLKREFPHLFGAWLDPSLYVWSDVGNAVIRNQWFLETDFKAEDQYYTRFIVREFILPVYQLLLSPVDYLHFAAFVEEAFEQPLLCGNQLWTGEHTLFSGLPFTNDFETLYAIIVYLGAHLLAGGDVDTFGYAYKGIGDDVLYTDKNETQVRTVYDLVRDEFSRNGVLLHEEKTRIQRGNARFCRHVYYPACTRFTNALGLMAMRPAYPLILAINNCVQPEVTAATFTDELCAVFQRLDNGAGHYQFENVVTWLLAKIPSKIRRPIDVKFEQAFETLQLKDWWYKVYGSTYTLGESRAAAIYRKLTD